MEINLIPNPHGRKFSNEFKGEEIPLAQSVFWYFLLSSQCQLAVQQQLKSTSDLLLNFMLLKL